MMSVLDKLLALPPGRIPPMTPAGRSALFVENMVAHRGHSFDFVSRSEESLAPALEGFTMEPLTMEQIGVIRRELLPFQNAVLDKPEFAEAPKGKPKKK